MHEIVTLQFGHFANYIGTHFWNTQESYFTYSDDEISLIDHDVMFRGGMGTDRTETYTPRALIYDLKGGFGSMKKINALYDVGEADRDDTLTSWDRKKEIRQTSAIPRHEYQKNLDEGVQQNTITDDTVRYWSDFNRVFYHPRSSIQLNEFEWNNTLTPFEAFDAGTDLFRDIDRDEDILDRDFRHFAEDCDLMQGIQIFSTIDDGWGGFCSEYLNHIRDEYPKTIIWTWACERGNRTLREKQTQRTTAALHSISAIASLSTTLVPIYLPRPLLNFPSSVNLAESSSAWHVSAVISAAIETATISARFRNGNKQLGEISSFLNQTGRRNISSICMGVLESGGKMVRAQVADLSWPSKKEHIFASWDMLRCSTHPSNYTTATDTRSEEHVYESHSTTLPYSKLDSSPSIFSGLSETTMADIGTSLTTSTAVCERLDYFQGLVRRLTAVEERETLENTYAEMQEAYREEWDSDFDHDE